MIELGISTFGETTEIEGTGIAPSHDERIRDYEIGRASCRERV